MINQRQILLIVSGVLFLGLFKFGLFLAERKPLWIDEIFGQVATVERFSYLEMISGQINSEGNISPLFFIFQKLICDVSSFRAPTHWNPTEQILIHDSYPLILLRIFPVFFISAAIAVVFYFFSKIFSYKWAVLSVILFLSSYPVITYWVEARHYGLWILLSTIQYLLFMKMMRQKEVDSASFWCLMITHFLLSLTVIFSAVQIFIVSALIFVFKDRQFKKIVWLLILPVGIALFYYFRSPHYLFWVPDKFFYLFKIVVPWPQMIIAGILVFMLGAHLIVKRIWKREVFLGSYLFTNKDCLSAITLLFVAAFCVIRIFILREQADHVGFKIHFRYFVFLTPIFIISTVFFIRNILKSVERFPWLRINLSIIFVGLITMSVFDQWQLMLINTHLWKI